MPHISTLRDVGPNLPVYYQKYQILTDSEFIPELLLSYSTRGIRGSDFNNIGFSKLRAVMVNPSSDWNATLGKRIPHIISVGSKKEMVWIPAQRIVARMADFELWRNSSFVSQPRNTMNSHRFGIDHDCAISVVLSGTSPYKTRGIQRPVLDKGFLPQSINKNGFWKRHSHWLSNTIVFLDHLVEQFHRSILNHCRIRVN